MKSIRRKAVRDISVSLYHTLTFHVVGLECVTDVQRGQTQQHVRLQGLVAPHAKHQFAEWSHNPVQNKQFSWNIQCIDTFEG